jgi:hypothetical protein
MKQEKSNQLIGIASKLTESLSAGLIYHTKGNLSLISSSNETTINEDGEIEVTGEISAISTMKQDVYTVPISYQLNQNLLLGLSFNYTEFKLKNSIADTSGSETVNAFYPQIGILFSPEKTLNCGVTYTFKSQTNKGTIAYSQDYENETISKKKLPASYGFGCSFTPWENLVLSMEFQKKYYSEVLSEYCNDQSSIKTGIEYSPSNYVAIRLGYYNAPNYIKKKTLPYLIDIKQEFLTYGIGFNINEWIQLNIAAQDSSIFKSGDIKKSQYLANIQISL